MEYILSNFEAPMFRTFNDVAIPVGVLKGNISELNGWLASHYIDMHFKLSWNQIVFNNKPFYEWDCFFSESIGLNTKTFNQFIDSVRHLILNRYYLYLFVNEKYIPNRGCYQKRNFIHDLCIYGFNDEKQCFYISAYNVEQLYTFEKISYLEMYSAFTNFNLHFRQIDKYKWKNRVIIFKVNNNYNFKDIDYQKLKKDIYQYCIPTAYGSGIKIYDYILKKIGLARKKNINLDMRNFRILQEHIYALFQLNHKDIDYKENYLISENISLMALKYVLKNDKNLLFSIEKELVKLKQKEIEALEPYARKHFNESQYKKFVKIYKEFDLIN